MYRPITADTVWDGLTEGRLNIARKRDVTLVPWGADEPKGPRRAAGVFAQDGSVVEEGTCWRWQGETATVPPAPPVGRAEERLTGRWMFAGLLYGHFGHFMCESTARLWALSEAEFDGIIFYPKPQLRWERRLVKQNFGFFEALDLGGIAVRAPQRDVEIEELWIPDQGFGVGELTAGHPQFRKAMRERLTRRIEPAGAERIYVSRSRLNRKRGTTLYETRMEEHLAADGYTIYYPEEHSITDQIAQYRAAREIVSLDGSALHLAAMVLDPSSRVAIIKRAPSTNIADYDRQFRGFAGVKPLLIDAITGFYAERAKRVVRREVKSTLDLPAIAAALGAAGMISNAADWEGPPVAWERAVLAEMEASQGRSFDFHDVSVAQQASV